jgi:protein phosphatase
MGTTWTSAHLFPGSAVIVHVGDSRAYLRHEGLLVQITRDETLAEAMLDSGLSLEEVRRFRHILTNSFGGRHLDCAEPRRCHP